MTAKLNLLIVDDDPEMGKTLVDILHVNRYAAQAVTSGSEALQLLTSQSFDCVLTDIRMPEMDGVQLYRRLQQLQPGLPVVLMTAYATGELIETALAEGAVAILRKPLNIPRLLAFLERLATPAGITIIDADADLCARLANILWEAGFLATILHDLERLHSAIHAETQVILLDLHIQEDNGMKTLQTIHQQFPKVEVIVFTKHPKNSILLRQKGLLHQVTAVLAKPLKLNHLLALIHRARNIHLGCYLTG